jgi:thiol-disulfide isomerase/thioredoxin
MRPYQLIIVVMLLLVFGCTQSTTSSTITNTTKANVSAPFPSNPFSNLSTNPASVNETTEPEPNLPTVDYYFSPKCSACNEIAPLMVKLQENLSGVIYFRRHDLTTQKGWNDFNAFTTRFSVPDNKRYIPVLVIGNKTFTGLDGIKSWIVYPELLEFANSTPISANRT